MAIKKLDHVSILTREPEKLIDFYKTFLGFEFISKREVKEMQINIFELRARDEFIELMEPLGEIKMSDGIKHIAFLSDNIEEDFEYFKEKGASLLHKEVQKHDNLQFFFSRSPGGEYVEVIQYF